MRASLPFAFALLALTVPALAQAPAPAPAPAAQEPALEPAAAVARLQKTFADKDPGAALAAVESCGRIANDDVVKALAKGLSHKEPAVQRAVISALRFQTQPSAFTALLAASTSERLLADDKVAADYYLALGQRGDSKALPVLTKGLRIDKGSEVVRARILAIGHIRAKESVEALMQLMKSGGGGGGGKGGGRSNNPHLRDLVTALTALTGQELGNDETAWIRWWGEHDEGYKVPAKEGALGKGAGRQWESLWRDPAEKGSKRDGKGGGKDKGDGKDPGKGDGG